MSCLLGCDETNLLDQFLGLLAQELNQIARSMASFGQEKNKKTETVPIGGPETNNGEISAFCIFGPSSFGYSFFYLKYF